jgi:two-component system, LuxR family, response regulator FixJ
MTMSNEEMTVYVVDDDEAVRDSLEILLDAVGHRVRTFASPRALLELAPSLGPGCAVLDVRMPEMDGLELQEELNARGVHLPVIVMTGHGDVPIAVRAMKAGALDFLEKPFADEALLHSVRLALDLSRHRAAGRGGIAEEAASRVAQLTDRERQVLDKLVDGLPNKTIAFDLGISPRTVEIHRARVMEKMQAKSLSELVRLAIAAGVSPPGG